MAETGAALWSRQFLDDQGNPQAGVKVYHYLAGTTTDADVWVDAGKTATAGQPVQGHSDGTVSFYGDNDYRLKVETNDGILLYDFDDVRITAAHATQYAANRGTSLPAVTTKNTGQLFALLDGTAFDSLYFNEGGSTGFKRIVRGEAKTLINELFANVKDYGLKGDGVTNDTTKFREMIDEIPDGTTIYFDDGTYLIQQTSTSSGAAFVTRSNIEITGSPGALIKRFGNAGDANVRLMRFITNCSNIHIHHLRFDTNGIGAFGGLGFSEATNVRIHDCHLFDSNPQVSASDKYGIVFGSAAIKHEKIWIYNNLIEDLQVELNTAENAWVYNNRVRNGGGTCCIGVFGRGTGGCENIWIEDNSVDTGTISETGIIACGIEAAGEDNNTFKGIHVNRNRLLINHPDAWGIRVGRLAAGSAMTGNVLEDIQLDDNEVIHASNSVQDVIGVRGTVTNAYTFKRLKVRGNTCHNTGAAAGIAIKIGVVQDGIVSGNQVVGFTGAGAVGLVITDQADKTRVYDNMVEATTGYNINAFNLGSGGNDWHDNLIAGTPTTRYGSNNNLHSTDRVRIDEVIVRTQLTADQNDYTPSPRHIRVNHISANATRTITGLGQPTYLEEVIFVITGTQNIIFAHQNSGSAEANRIITETGADVTKVPNEVAELVYDPEVTRWRLR